MRLAGEQAGIVTRTQVLDHGFSDCWLKHQVAAHRWRRVHTGVYATFTGERCWAAQCSAALLRCGDSAALAGVTALHAWHPSMPGIATSATNRDIIVAVDSRCRPRPQAGIEVWSVADLERHVHPVRRPRMLRFEVAVLLSASRAATLDEAVTIIANACQSRRTTPERLLQLLHQMPGNLRFRGFLSELLEDVATGAYSFLEVHYLRDVERPHGLPTGTRQRRVVAGRRPYFRDVEYLGYRVVAELDGRLGHEDFVSRANDMDRDTDTAHADARTARIGYLQVMSRRCVTARRVAGLLRLGGWTGKPRRCGPGCSVS
jgi:hypothetical protein